MLERLYVENFAIIEKIEVLFNEGMTVLTGQTGAGKSLILDTISLLLGDRSNQDMIRYGKTKAIIEGVFSYNNPKIDEVLDELKIKQCNKLTIRREITANKKNIIRVNNELVTLIDLKKITRFLADIHVQHDTLRLLNNENYLTILDKNNLEIENLKNDYQIALYKYLKALKDYDKIIKAKNNVLEKLDYLEYAYDEISKLGLKENEDIDLEYRISKLENHDKIYQNLHNSYAIMNDEQGILNLVFDVKEAIKKISLFDNNYNDYLERLNNIYYDLEDLKSSIAFDIENNDFDPNELDYLQARLESINVVKKKYHKNVNELILYLKELDLEIILSTNYDATQKKAFEDVLKTFDELKVSALKLSDKRKEKALILEMDLKEQCCDLGLENIEFKICFNDVVITDCLNKEVFKEDGIDIINFMVTLNKGEPLKMLDRVASGGELSRIMLAFKAIMAQKYDYSLMVFDEIDTGVSGAMASLIASKMQQIARYNQVLVISHLPQVAAIATNQINICKKEENDLTYTYIEYLTYEQRIYNIASMLSGKNVSSLAIETAKQMIDENI